MYKHQSSAAHRAPSRSSRSESPAALHPRRPHTTTCALTRPPHLPPVAHQRQNLPARRLQERVQRSQGLQVPYPHLALYRP
jgi:hypothetical protein